MCAAVKISGSSVFTATGYIFTSDSSYGGLDLRGANGGNTLNIYYGNTFRASTPAYDWQDFHYIAFRYQNSPSIAADVYVDGVLGASYTVPGTRTSSGLAVWNNGTNANRMCIAQILTWDAATPVATATQPYFVTRISPNEDVTGSGTWSPAANPGAPV